MIVTSSITQGVTLRGMSSDDISLITLALGNYENELKKRILSGITLLETGMFTQEECKDIVFTVLGILERKRKVKKIIDNLI